MNAKDNLPSWDMLEKDPVMLMQVITTQYLRILQQRAEEDGAEKPHKGRGFPLYVLLENGQPVERDQKEIADMLKISPSTLTASLKRLENSGFIEKHEDPQDLRRKLIRLTDKGMDFIQRRRQAGDRLRDIALAGMSQEEQARFRGQLIDIYQRLSAVARE